MTARLEWFIRICRRCGCPLGAAIVVKRLERCPDCDTPTSPLDERTYGVEVYADEEAPR